MTITPQTHPSLFAKETVAGFDYYIRKNTEGVTVGVREDVEAAYEEAYRSSQKIDGPIDDAAYNTWRQSSRGSRMCDAAAAKVLFIPATPETPTMEGDVLRWLSQPQLVKALGFFGEDAPNKTDAPSELTDSSSPAADSNKTA